MSMAQDEEYATAGPLARIFGGAEARVLDQVRVVGNMEQTIATLSESTNLSFKTTQTAVKKLVGLGFMMQTRRMGNAQAYRFVVEGQLRGLIQWLDSVSVHFEKVGN